MSSPDQILSSTANKDIELVSQASPSLQSQKFEEVNSSQPIEWALTEGDVSSIDVRLEVKSHKSVQKLSKKKIDHQDYNNETRSVIEKYYKTRVWSLLYPLIVSLYLAVNELDLSLRIGGYGFVATVCLWSLLSLKDPHRQRNLGFIIVVVLCMGISVVDFLYQFSIIGSQGWEVVKSYQNCFKSAVGSDKEAETSPCSLINTVYYLNALVYLGILTSFSVYLFATTKLLKAMKAMKTSKDGDKDMTKLEDEGDCDE